MKIRQYQPGIAPFSLRVGAAVLLGLLQGCTWVELTDAGAGIRVAGESEVSACKRVGKVTAVSRAKVVGMNRNQDVLRGELETLARNEAAGLKGNTIAPLGPIEGNEQRFGVYDCGS